MAGGRRLFSSVVVMGASLTGGCGGATDAGVGTADHGSDGAGGAGAAAGSGGVASATGGAASSGGATGSAGAGTGNGGAAGAVTSNGGAAGSGGAGPLTPDDCADPAQFRCTDYALLVGCRCDESATLPGQCLPQRLQCSCTPLGGAYGTFPCVPAHRAESAMECSCAESGPLSETDCTSTAQFSCLDWTDPRTSCRCDPSAPLRAEDCPPGDYFQCFSLEPLFGCRCMARIG